MRVILTNFVAIDQDVAEIWRYDDSFLQRAAMLALQALY